MGGCSTAHTPRDPLSLPGLKLPSKIQTPFHFVPTKNIRQRALRNKEESFSTPVSFRFPSTLTLTWRGAQPRVLRAARPIVSASGSPTIIHQETPTRKPLYFMLSVLIPILTSETPVFVTTTQLAHLHEFSPGHPRSNTGKFNNSRAPASSAIGIGASPSTVLSRAVCKKDQCDISLWSLRRPFCVW